MSETAEVLPDVQAALASQSPTPEAPPTEPAPVAVDPSTVIDNPEPLAIDLRFDEHHRLTLTMPLAGHVYGSGSTKAAALESAKANLEQIRDENRESAARCDAALVVILAAIAALESELARA